MTNPFFREKPGNSPASGQVRVGCEPGMNFSGNPDCDLPDGSDSGRLAVVYFHSNVSASYGAFHVPEKSGNAWHPVAADNVMASKSSL
jgi:hypothetical protein